MTRNGGSEVLKLGFTRSARNSDEKLARSTFSQNLSQYEKQRIKETRELWVLGSADDAECTLVKSETKYHYTNQ